MKIALNLEKQRTLCRLLDRFQKSRPDGVPLDYYGKVAQNLGLIEEGVLFFIQQVYDTPYSFMKTKNPRFEIQCNDWSLTFQADMDYRSWSKINHDMKLTDLRLTGSLESFNRDLIFAKMHMTED